MKYRLAFFLSSSAFKLAFLIANFLARATFLEMLTLSLCWRVVFLKSPKFGKVLFRSDF